MPPRKNKWTNDYDFTFDESDSEKTNERTYSMDNVPVKTIAGFLGLIVTVILSLWLFTFETVKGNELGVMETFTGGVDPNPLPPKTYFRNRFTTTIYHYDLSSQVFVMNDNTASSGERGRGRESDAYLVQSSDQQDMHINLNVRWRLDPAKVIDIHKTYHAHIDNRDDNILEERLIRPAVMLIVKNHATKMKAMEAYSGEGLVRLQTEIERDLASMDGDIRKQGIVIDNFVIEKIVLDPNYTAEIKARQIAQQKKLRADEETKAAESDAIKAKAVAQADLNRAVVEAERDKQVALLKAEQEGQSKVIAAKAAQEQTVLAAKASAEQVTIAANAEKEAAEARATAIKALGEANAAARKLEFTAYSAPGADVYAQIQIADSMARSFQNINGYLPQGMSVNLLSDNFMTAVRTLMKPTPTLPVPAVK